MENFFKENLQNHEISSNLFQFLFTNHLKSLPPSLVSPNLKNSKPKVPKK